VEFARQRFLVRVEILLGNSEEVYMEKNRCRWCNLDNPLYVKYHDEEWCVPAYDDKVLFEFIILESFQAGLSWETILNKRESFRIAFDDFNVELIKDYTEEKIAELMNNKCIIRNRRKIDAAINNAKVFKDIQAEWGSFSDYIWHFTDGQVICEVDKTSSELSDFVSKDMKRRGMKFVGTTIIYSYLQAIGVIYSHEKECFMYKQ